MLARGADQLLDYRAVDLVERCRPLVHVVERLGRLDHGGRWMACRAHEPHRDALDRRGRGGGDEVGSGGPEADDRDPRGQGASVDEDCVGIDVVAVLDDGALEPASTGGGVMAKVAGSNVP